MARVNTYLNFTSETEEAFAFYRSVLGASLRSCSASAMCRRRRASPRWRLPIGS